MDSSRSSLASRTHFEVLGIGLGLNAQVLGLEPYKSLKMPCPRLEDSIAFWLVERKITKHKNFLNSGIGVARIFDWGGPNPQITRNTTSSEIFRRRDFLWNKNILEWKIRSLGPGLVRKQDVAKGGGLEPKVNVFKIGVKFYCGGSVKKLL